MRHLLFPLAAVASLSSFSALAQDAAVPDGWNTQGGYVGISGGYAHGRYDSEDIDRNGKLDNDKSRYTDEASVDSGWHGTLESGAILPLGQADWLRLRLGGEGGYGRYDLDTYRDGFSGDTVSGDFNLLRVGPAAALDFRIPRTPLSFTVGAGGGLAVVNFHSSVSNGILSRTEDDDKTTWYLSGVASINYALAPNLDLCLGVRAIWLDDVHINGTPTLAGSTLYSVRHEVPVTGAVELGLRWTF